MQSKKDLTSFIIEAISDKKGKKIALIDLSEFESASTGKLIICQGGSTSQVSAIADSVREVVQKNANVKPYNYEGYNNCQWIVIDYGDIMVHIFLPEYRNFYNLEDLWNDAPVEFLPDID
ncbi:MAG: ribosome silencing factor [Muribaculaceae bacterium]|nr:ribosome silencing factor [Muribaculaceae bacterium]